MVLNIAKHFCPLINSGKFKKIHYQRVASQQVTTNLTQTVQLNTITIYPQSCQKLTLNRREEEQVKDQMKMGQVSRANIITNFSQKNLPQITTLINIIWNYREDNYNLCLSRH